MLKALPEPGYPAVSSGSWVLEREGRETGEVSGPQIPKGVKVKLTFTRVHRVI